VGFAHGSKGRLTTHDLDRFPGETLFDRIGRAVCRARCLPRKELYEAWEVARRARRMFRGGRVVDVAGGHGLLAHIMLLLDSSSSSAIVVDPAIPPSAARLAAALTEVWPVLENRVLYEANAIDEIALSEKDVVVSSHACGALTDRVIDRAVLVRAAVAVLPCCHDLQTCDAGDLRGWMDGPLAIDTMRAVRLNARGYRVWTQTIPSEVTPKNRLLLGKPIGFTTENTENPETITL
jgi:hypothetical protein